MFLLSYCSNLGDSFISLTHQFWQSKNAGHFWHPDSLTSLLVDSHKHHLDSEFSETMCYVYSLFILFCAVCCTQSSPIAMRIAVQRQEPLQFISVISTVSVVAGWIWLWWWIKGKETLSSTFFTSFCASNLASETFIPSDNLKYKVGCHMHDWF